MSENIEQSEKSVNYAPMPTPPDKK